MNKLRTIIYRSRARPEFSIEAIQEMLFEAKRNNSNKGITGFILYGNQQFIQLIEGENSEIGLLYDSIKEDIRHHQVATLLDQQNDRRIFPDWFMSFYNLSTKNDATSRKQLLLDSFLSQEDGSENVQITLRTLRSGIYNILDEKNQD